RPTASVPNRLVTIVLVPGSPKDEVLTCRGAARRSRTYPGVVTALIWSARRLDSSCWAGSNLKIVGVRQDDEGKYARRRARLASTRLTSTFAPSYREHHRVVWYHNGTRKRTENSIDGTSTYLEYHLGHSDAGLYECEAANDNGVKRKIVANKLDAGMYTCVAMNPGGDAKGRVLVQVWTKPFFTHEPADTAAASGDRILLDCRAKGTPVPRLSWLKDSNPFTYTDRHLRHANGSLTILVAKVTDSGVYQCVAENRLGSVESHAAGWSNCSVSCGSGIRLRQRRCDNPAPANGGRFCSGPGQETLRCLSRFCPIDAGWSRWGDWEPCSASCGLGVQLRARGAQYDGRPCDGSATGDPTVRRSRLPSGRRLVRLVGLVGLRSDLRRRRFRDRRRRCNSPSPVAGGRQCPGSFDAEYRACDDLPACGKAENGGSGSGGSFQPWPLGCLGAAGAACSLSCGGGQRTRQRDCLQVSGPATRMPSRECDGGEPASSQSEPAANNQPVPAARQLVGFGQAGPPALCDGGEQSRRRKCSEARHARAGPAWVAILEEASLRTRALRLRAPGPTGAPARLTPVAAWGREAPQSAACNIGLFCRGPSVWRRQDVAATAAAAAGISIDGGVNGRRLRTWLAAVFGRLLWHRAAYQVGAGSLQRRFQSAAASSNASPMFNWGSGAVEGVCPPELLTPVAIGKQQASPATRETITQLNPGRALRHCKRRRFNYRPGTPCCRVYWKGASVTYGSGRTQSLSGA
uniref:Ig-like domain-containing protein n=1 Tax=Macrostomum lignano TaxID=282301 RepID=A0A1I8FIB2_9PLAT